MKYKIVLTSLLFTSIAGCTSVSDEKLNNLESDLLGKWNCESVDSLGGLQTRLKYDVSYFRNGKANSSGQLQLRVGNNQPYDYYIASTMSWFVKDGHLVEEAEDVIIKAKQDVPKDSILDLESLVPEGITESSKIIEVNDKFLKLLSLSTNTEMTCQKV